MSAFTARHSGLDQAIRPRGRPLAGATERGGERAQRAGKRSFARKCGPHNRERLVIQVLVVNGSADSRLSIARALLQAGDVRVVGETANPHVACEYVALFAPDVVVLDSSPSLEAHCTPER